ARARARGAQVPGRLLPGLRFANIAIGGALSIVNCVQNLSAAQKAWDKGDTAGFSFEVVQGVANGTLAFVILLGATATPVGLALQGAATLVLLFSGLAASLPETPDTRISSPVNNHLRATAEFAARADQNPLATLLSASERGSLAQIVSACNALPIVHPLAGQDVARLPDPLNLLKQQVTLLRNRGFDLVQVANLVGRPLAVEDLE
ncbi:MAG: hypothetical protein KC731_04235, partial [Myxococcales bacterium]|nr:hypothetical protein [Myxococcales bacterium]